MNERIKQLKQQATDYVDSVDDGLGIEHYRELVDLKFTELIVRECASRAETKLLKNLKSNETHQLSYNEGLRDGVLEFKKHFGVEE
jgi:tRNA(His) 5'-end guanylyltransferase